MKSPPVDRRPRRGFTLIEALVVIAVIGLLVALLLPAVQSAREAARRVRCVNNLEQLGLAVQSYSDVNGVLPPAASAGPEFSNNFSMKVRILPFIEQAALFDSMNMSYWQESAPNATSLTTIVDAFLCPSDGNVPCGTYSVSGPGARQVGYTSYPNNVGTLPYDYGKRYDGPAYFMGVGGPVSLAGVTDGTSQTALWSEIVRGKNGTATPGPNQVYLMSIPLPLKDIYEPLVNYLDACQAATTLSGFDYKGRIWGTDYGAEGGGYSHIMTPNRNACIFRGQREAQPIEWLPMCVGPSSFHPGGVNVGFLDGSVKFIEDGVDPRTWWGLATRAGGEIIDGGRF